MKLPPAAAIVFLLLLDLHTSPNSSSPEFLIPCRARLILRDIVFTSSPVNAVNSHAVSPNYNCFALPWLLPSPLRERAFRSAFRAFCIFRQPRNDRAESVELRAPAPNAAAAIEFSRQGIVTVSYCCAHLPCRGILFHLFTRVLREPSLFCSVYADSARHFCHPFCHRIRFQRSSSFNEGLLLLDDRHCGISCITKASRDLWGRGGKKDY